MKQAIILSLLVTTAGVSGCATVNTPSTTAATQPAPPSPPDAEQELKDFAYYSRPARNGLKAVGRSIYWLFDSSASLIGNGLSATRDAIPETVRTTVSDGTAKTTELTKDGALYALSLMPDDIHPLLPDEIVRSMPAPSEPEKANPAALPEQGQAMVYVIRPHFTGVLNHFEVYLNGKTAEDRVGYTQHYEYLAFPVEPGRHTIYSKGENWSEIGIQLREGEFIFLEQKASRGLFLSNQTLQSLPLDKARTYLAFTEPGTLESGESVPDYRHNASHLFVTATERTGKRLDKATAVITETLSFNE
ncbi:hypothetical protein [Kistimonas asteriae]|uniref:hypothetical protein n=1 Tax=Kistimonas asteriae TaxID=517724 RepID=UPI001BA8F175|nr:hypothetical protein [Kistimonas asteriae]